MLSNFSFQLFVQLNYVSVLLSVVCVSTLFSIWALRCYIRCIPIIKVSIFPMHVLQCLRVYLLVQCLNTYSDSWSYSDGAGSESEEMRELARQKATQRAKEHREKNQKKISVMDNSSKNAGGISSQDESEEKRIMRLCTLWNNSNSFNHPNRHQWQVISTIKGFHWNPHFIWLRSWLSSKIASLAA